MKLPRISTRHASLAAVACLAGLVGVATPSVVSAQDADLVFPAFTFLRGADVPVRSPGETEFSDETKTVPVEVYRDEDFGSVLMVSSSGSIAAMPQPEIFLTKTVGVSEELVAVRFMPRSGTTWVMENLTWVPVSESDDAPVYLGDYDVQMAPTDGVVWYLRTDSLTGRTWVLAREDANEPPIWIYAADPDLDEPADD